MANAYVIVPQAKASAVLRFCRELRAQDPVYVPSQPMEGAQAAQCYANCASFIQRQGGAIQFGWLLWELPQICVFAEHHAVVHTPHELIDVTPRLAATEHVLFASHDGEPPIVRRNGIEWVPTRYAPLSDHWIPKRICKLRELYDQPPDCTLPSHIAVEVDRLILAYRAWLQIVQQVETFQKSLDERFDVAISLSRGNRFAIESVACREPYFLVVSGRSEDGAPVTLVQHLSQMRFLLSGIKRADPGPRRRICFDSPA